MCNPILAAAILVVATVTVSGCRKLRSRSARPEIPRRCARRYRSVSNQAPRSRSAGKVKGMPNAIESNKKQP